MTTICQNIPAAKAELESFFTKYPVFERCGSVDYLMVDFALQKTSYKVIEYGKNNPIFSEVPQLKAELVDAIAHPIFLLIFQQAHPVADLRWGWKQVAKDIRKSLNDAGGDFSMVPQWKWNVWFLGRSHIESIMLSGCTWLDNKRLKQLKKLFGEGVSILTDHCKYIKKGR